MFTVLSLSDYIVIFIMLLLSASVGLYFRFTGGRQKTIKEFLMGDKNMGIIPVSFSLMATSYSAVTILGVPAETYLYGMQRIMADVGYPIGLLLASYLIVPVYFEMEVDTIYQYLGKRFGNVIKMTTSILYSIQMILYMPIVLYAPSLALSFVTDLSVWMSVLSMGLVCTFYSALGGLKAVLWADVFQSLLMFFMNFALLVKGSMDSGGTKEVFRAAGEGQRLEIFNSSIDPTVRYTLWNTLVEGLMYGLFINGTTFTQVQRLLSAGSVKKAQKSLLWTILLSTFFRLSGCLLGIVIYAYYRNCNPLQDENIKIISADQLVPLFILTLFGHLPGLSGLCVAGIFSASLSTMSSAVNALVAVTLEDYIKPHFKTRNLKDSTMTILAKALALFYGGFCLFLTFVMANSKGVLEAGTVIVGMVAGPTLGVFCLGMFTLRANELGVLIGLITGFGFHAWMGFGSLYHATKYPSLPLSASGCAADRNSSFYYNSSLLLDFGVTNTSCVDCVSNQEERYPNVFPMYKVSFLWFTFMSAFITILVGYFTSLIVGFNKKQTVVDPRHLSPVFRKWLVKSSNSKKEYMKVLQEIKEVDYSEETELQVKNGTHKSPIC